MPTDQWSFMVTELRTHRVVARELPLTAVSFSDDLLGKGKLSATIRWGHPAFAQRLSDDGLRRVVWPFRGTVPMGAYVLSSAPPTNWTDPDQQIQCDHLSSIFTRRVLDRDVSYNNQDRMRIVRDLQRFGTGLHTVASTTSVKSKYADAAAVPGLGHQDANASGQRLTISFSGSERKTIAACITEVLKSESPPEFRWLYRTVDGLPYMLGNSGTPTVGTPRDKAGRIVFEFPSPRRGGAVTSARYGFDSTAIITRPHVVGQEKEGARPVGEAVYQDLLDQGYPLLETVWSEQESDQAKLDAMAQGRIAAASDSWTLTLDGRKEPTFGSYGLGDFVRLRTRRNGIKQERDLRITGWTVKVGDDMRSETVSPVTEAW